MRKSKTTSRTTITGRDDLESVFGEYAAVVIETDALKAEMEEQIRQVRAGYADRFAEMGDEAGALLDDIGAWAAGNPASFKEKKSLELLHGVIGFRTSTPRVALPRGTDEEDLATTLVDSGLDCYVRVRRELDKQRILAAVAGAEGGDEAEAVLGAYGIKVRQGEKFFAEVRREAVSNK